MITPRSTVSQMKLALLDLGCGPVRVTVWRADSAVRVKVETSHPKVSVPIVVEKAFTPVEYLGGPMQPIYWEIYQRVLDARKESKS